MPGDESSQEKTEDATPHRKEEAIKRGEVVHSKEVVTAAIVLMSVLFLPVLQPLFTRTLERVFHIFFRFDQLSAADVPTFKVVMIQAALSMLPIVAPVCLMVFFVGIAANVIQVGWKVSSQKMEPKLDRLSPAKGAERIVGRRALAEAVRTIIKFMIVGIIAFITVKARFDDILGLHRLQPADFIPVVANLLWHIAWRVALLMVAFAILDYGYQRWDWGRRLRMSRQELKEELKEREGNPLIKQRIRSIQMEQARRRMMQDVKGATAVVTNPTHCAVAIRYEAGVDAAPIVVGKGVDHLAGKIREVAQEAGIPLVENKPLAWALYRGVKIGRTVPAHLYQAVAEVLAYVFRIGGAERLERVRRRLADAKRRES